VVTLTCNWAISSARDLAWHNAGCCGQCTMIRSRGLFLHSLAASTALASRMLLVAV